MSLWQGGQGTMPAFHLNSNIPRGNASDDHAKVAYYDIDY